MFKLSVAALAATLCLIVPAHALEEVKGRQCTPQEIIHSPWPSTVAANSCTKPVYLREGLLYGNHYPEGCYCLNISVLRAVPYDPAARR